MESFSLYLTVELEMKTDRNLNFNTEKKNKFLYD